ncbi:MAG: helix-turn-helix transcriptional regulator [Polyangiaceae bacterium]
MRAGCDIPVGTLQRYDAVVRAAASRQSFFDAPIGRYVRGDTWLFACVRADLYATFLAGRPTEAELDALTRVYQVPLAAREAHAILFDATRVHTLDTAAFDTLLGHFHAHAPALSRRATKVAVASGDGPSGAVFAGYPKVISLACPYRVFRDTESAAAWLGCEGDLGRELHAAADLLTATDAVETRLAAILEDSPALSLVAAARAIGVSPRSLQRRLKQVGTSFQSEVDRGRMVVARRLLMQADQPLAAVALALGFSSHQSFTDWFRSQTGESPTAWRQRARGGAAHLPVSADDELATPSGTPRQPF